MQKDEYIIERLIVGRLAKAAFLGTYKANQKAQAAKIPMVIEKDGKLYQINADGLEHYLRDIEKPNIKLKKIKLK